MADSVKTRLAALRYFGRRAKHADGVVYSTPRAGITYRLHGEDVPHTAWGYRCVAEVAGEDRDGLRYTIAQVYRDGWERPNLDAWVALLREARARALRTLSAHIKECGQ